MNEPNIKVFHPNKPDHQMKWPQPTRLRDERFLRVVKTVAAESVLDAVYLIRLVTGFGIVTSKHVVRNIDHLIQRKIEKRAKWLLKCIDEKTKK